MPLYTFAPKAGSPRDGHRTQDEQTSEGFGGFVRLVARPLARALQVSGLPAAPAPSQQRRGPGGVEQGAGVPTRHEPPGKVVGDARAHTRGQAALRPLANLPPEGQVEASRADQKGFEGSRSEDRPADAVYSQIMTSSGMLGGSPYLLDEQHGEVLMRASGHLTEKVALLRRNKGLDEVTLSALRREWNIEQVYESAGIEGNSLTLNETKLAISRGVTISGKPPEHTDEVKHLHEAHQFLEELLKEKDAFTQRQLLDIHSLVLGRGASGAGEYRKVEVAIGNQKHKPPHPIKVPEMMADYFSWTEQAFHNCPVPLQAAVAHAWLVHIHPFRDGNGRTARAVMNLLLMRSGFPIVIIRRKDRQRYYDALACSDEGDIGPLLELFVARAEDSLRQIDRVRAAVTGLTLEMERISAAEEREVSVWNAAIGLLCEEVASALERIRTAEPAFNVEWRRFEPIDRDDYRALSERQMVSQSWIARFTLSRGNRSFRTLLWAGVVSDAMGKGARGKPALFFSEPNPDGYPQWRLPTPGFATDVREIVYAEGRFLVRREGKAPAFEESTTKFALDFVSGILRNAFP